MTVSRRDKEVDISKKQVVRKEEVESKFWVSNQQCPWNRLLYLIVPLLFQMKDYSIYNLSIPASYPYIQLQTVSTSTNLLKLFLGTLEGQKAQIMLWTAVVSSSSDLSCSALRDWEVPKIQTILPSWITHAQNLPWVNWCFVLWSMCQSHTIFCAELGQMLLISCGVLSENYFLLFISLSLELRHKL